MNGQTIFSYTGALPTVTGTVTLFNSATSFPPGGSFHLLGQQWFQFSARIASDGGAATGTIVGSYSNDKGTTWVPFYTSATVDADDDDAAAAADVQSDEVYVGIYKDIRFQYTNANEAPTVFDVQMSLNCHKPTSKHSAADVLVDDNAAAGPIDIVDVTT